MQKSLKFRSGFAALSVMLLASSGLCDALTLGGPFTDGAVLQRDRPVRVWGRAAPGEAVEVAFGGKSASCKADAKGAWRCELPAFAASRESRELVARAASGEVRVKDVVVGEVWLAGGQSNMEFPLWSSFIRLRDRQGALTAQMCEKPYVRCAVSRKQFQVQEDQDGKLTWKRFEPQMLLNYGIAAVGAYYALELYHALEVPVGIIEASRGGTMIEPWIPREGFAAIPELADLAAVRPKSKIITTDPAYREGRDNQQPTVLWNSCLSFVAPFQVRGTIWYQGESNLRNPQRYFDLMRGLYAGWSKRFENPDFKFYLVQIAPHNYEDSSRMCLLQEQQQRFADTEKNADIAIINDVGDLSEIHPHEKGTVGKRLAAFALANDYGFKAVKPRAPTPADVKFENGKVTIAFRDAEGLYAYDEPVGFELAGADGQWHDAQAVGFKGKRGGFFKGGKITLAAPEVLSPRHVRYLWKSPYQGHVFNGSGVPLGVFHRNAPGTERDLKVEVSDRYYVDGESGDDKAVGTSGTSAFKTIEGALARVRALRAAGRLAKDRRVTIDLGSGVHVVTKPIVLGPEDSNLLIRGPRPGNSVVRGGVELPPFVEEKPGLWSCPVPKGLAVDQLYVNERRCDLARTPNAGWFFMEDYPKEFVDPATGAVTTNKAAVRAFRPSAKDAAVLAGLSPEELRAVEVHVWQSWSDGVAHLQAYDPKTRTCVTTPSVHWPYSFWHWQGPKRYAFRNLRSALDAPGEWFHDKKAGRLYYVPRADERLDGVTAIVPAVESLLEIRGDRAKGKPVKNVTVEGILFEYAAYRLPAEGRGDAQAAVNEPAAVRVDDAEDLFIGDCAFKHVGAHALWLRNGVRKAKVTVCRFEDLGGGGVYVSEGTKHKPTDPESTFTREVTVDNCIVRSGGREMTGAVGIFLGSAASDCRITHNWISDLNYSGISCGWSWGYDPTQTKRNTIAWNHIHDLGHGVMSDMAGIYTLGLSEGTEIVGNVIHDVVSYDKSGRGGWGIYTDEGSSGIRIASNLVYRLKTGPVHQNYGRDNRFENNIFAFGGEEQIKRSSPKGESGKTNACSFVFSRNIVVMERNAGFAFARTKDISDTGYLKDVGFDRNVWWRYGGEIGTNAFECLSWDAWRALGKDGDSFVADPQFESPWAGNFRLKTSSPAFTCGFVPWDYAQAGLYRPSRYWLSGWWKQYETDVSTVCKSDGKPFFTGLMPAKEVRPRLGIGHALAKLEAGRPVSVAYFGGSITEMSGWRNLTTDWLRRAWPKSKITEINAAIGGTGSGLGVFRLGHDVLDKKPDLVFVEFATNDGSELASNIWRNFDGIVQQIWAANPETDIVFTYTITASMKDAYLAGKMNGAASAMDVLADHYGIPTVCFGPRVIDEVKANRLVMSMGEVPVAVPKETPDRDKLINEELKKKGQTLFAKDGVHPAMSGHGYYLKSIIACFDAMRGVKKAVDHRPMIGKPFYDGELAAAKMVPVTEKMFVGDGWKKLAEADPVQKQFASRGGQMWCGSKPGDKMVFRFKGTECAVYDLLGPDCGQVWITVDGKRQQYPSGRFDSFSTYYRLAGFRVFKGEYGEHAVEIEIDSKQPDRTLIHRRKPDVDVTAPKFNGTKLFVCQIELVGDLL